MRARRRRPWVAPLAALAAAAGLLAPGGAATGEPGGTGTDDSRPSADHSMPMVAVPPEAYVETAPRLARSTWSARSTPRGVVLDLGRRRVVSGLVLRPDPAPGETRRLERFEVRLSADGVTWGAPVAAGRWADDATERRTALGVRATRWIRLSAPPGTPTAPVRPRQLDVLGARTDPGYAAPAGHAAGEGRWGPVTGLPLVPSSAALLPGHRLLVWSGVRVLGYGIDSGRTQTAVVDLRTGRVGRREVVETDHEMFCTGIATLPDGRILITGGSDAGHTTIYDPARDRWSAGPRLHIPRGYQTDVTLSTGEVLTLGGSWSGGQGGKDGEVFSAGGRWRRLPGVSARDIVTDDRGGVYRADNHAWLFAVGGGGVFHAGPSRRMSWIRTEGRGAVRPAGVRGDDGDAMNGNAVMYDVGRILTAGGSPSYEDSDATRNAFTVDIAGAGSRPRVRRTGSMAAPRAFANGVVLPDGTVLVVGGQARAKPFTDTTAAMSPELWDPATGLFSTMARMAVPRTYHSVALLLPDGRVWAGGGGLCGDCATNHPDGQVFTPPYLLRPDGGLRARPRITAAPTRARHGEVVRVRTAAAVRSFALVRTSTVTHTVNSDQRRIPLRAGPRRDGGYRLRIPASSGTVVPGPYLLFAIDSRGTPSVARSVTIR